MRIQPASTAIRCCALTAVLVACIAVVGCDEDDKADTTTAQTAADPTLEGADPLIGTFVSTSDVQEKGPAFSTPVAVRIDKAHIGWQARCNSAGAKAEFTDDQIVIDAAKIASTLMGCEKIAEQQDKDLAAFFGSDPSWSLEGNNRLILSNDSVEVALQRDRTPTAPSSNDGDAAAGCEGGYDADLDTSSGSIEVGIPCEFEVTKPDNFGDAITVVGGVPCIVLEVQRPGEEAELRRICGTEDPDGEPVSKVTSP